MTRLLADPFDETGLDRQLGGGERQRLLGDQSRHAVDLEQDAAGLDPGHPVFRRALARAHAHFERLLRYRHVGKHPDPDPAGALHVPRQRAARRLDLARRHPLRLHRLEPELAERQIDRARRQALDTALVRLAEFGSHRLQHGGRLYSTRSRSSRVAPRPAGFALGHFLVLRHRVVLHDLALEDPHLDAAGAVGGEGGGETVIDVGAQRVQRHAALAIPLHPRDLGAAEPARTIDADATGAEPHRRLHGTLHGAAERDAALELLGDRFSNKLGVELRLANFDDVDDDVAVGQLGDLAAQLLDVGALFADNDAGTRRMNGDAALLVGPLDHDLRHRGLLELTHQRLADLHVLMQQRTVTGLAGVPARIPGAVDAETKPDRIDLLTHQLAPEPPVTTPAPRPRAPR